MLCSSGGGSVHLSTLQSVSVAISLVTATCQFFLLGIMTGKKGVRRDFPLFFAYNAYAATASIILTGIYVGSGQSSNSYFYFYWILNSILMLLEFGILYEVFVHVVKPYSGLIDLAKMLFLWAGVFLLIAAALTAFSANGSTLARCVALTNHIGKGLRLMQCGLLLLFFLFERRLGLSWRSRSVCTALGLSTSTAVGLCILYFQTQRPSWGMAFDLLDNGTYFLVVVAWLICFKLPEPARKNVLDSPSKLIFQRWNDVLVSSPFVSQQTFAMAAGESFLPSVERTVERVMARKMTN